jgi:pimeloyl-ACP methyl ester carboxylesterase
MSAASGEIAEVNGTRLAYEVAGAGPPVVLVHGLALDRRMWDDQVESFAAQHRVVRYDLRGFGASADPRVGEEYSHADDLRALLTHLGIRRGALVGLSLGGWVVLEFALTYPELVTALVLVNAVVRQYSFPHGWAANLQLVNQVARTSGLREAKELWLADPIFERSREIPGVATRLRRMVADYRGWQFLHDNPHTTMQPPALARLTEVAVPTLVIVGERDHADFRGMARLLAAQIPLAELVTIPGAGHMGNMDAPDQFGGIALSFLDRARPVE